VAVHRIFFTPLRHRLIVAHWLGRPATQHDSRASLNTGVSPMKRFASLASSALLLAVAALAIAAAPAVKNAIPAIIKALVVSPSDGLFEIDQPGANATDDATAGDDWQTLVQNPPGGAKAFTGIIDDFCGGSDCDDVFTGGSKDEQEIFEWTIDPTFNAPDKNQIVNAYAAQYIGRATAT
jgi:hypothetical protein